MGVTLDVGVPLAVGVTVSVAEAVGVTVSVGVTVHVSEWVGVWLRVGERVGEREYVGVRDDDFVGVTVSVGVRDTVDVNDGDTVGVGVSETVGVSLGVGVVVDEYERLELVCEGVGVRDVEYDFVWDVVGVADTIMEGDTLAVGVMVTEGVGDRLGDGAHRQKLPTQREALTGMASGLQNVVFTTVPFPAAQNTARVREPYPQETLQADHGPISQWNPPSHKSMLQSRTRRGRSKFASSHRFQPDEIPWDRQSTLRDTTGSVPGSPEKHVSEHKSHSCTRYSVAGHISALHTLTDGCLLNSGHAASGSRFDRESVQYVTRYIRPDSQSLEHMDHGPVNTSVSLDDDRTFTTTLRLA